MLGATSPATGVPSLRPPRFRLSTLMIAVAAVAIIAAMSVQVPGLSFAVRVIAWLFSLANVVTIVENRNLRRGQHMTKDRKAVIFASVFALGATAVLSWATVALAINSARMPVEHP